MCKCSTKSFPRLPTIQISVGRIITNTRKQLCSPNEPFVVVFENYKKKKKPKYLPLEWTLRFDRFMPKHTHYTLTKIQKVKKPNRTPLKC